MRALKWITLIVAVPLFSACGVPIQSGANFSPSWEPARHVTFAWRDTQDRIVGDSRLAGNEFFHQRLHEAVGWELSLRGMRYSETDPDVLIHHHLSLDDHERVTEMVDKEGVVGRKRERRTVRRVQGEHLGELLARGVLHREHARHLEGAACCLREHLIATEQRSISSQVAMIQDR